MSINNIRSIWKATKIIGLTCLAFWVIETIVFLLIHGGHYKPLCQQELICDLIVNTGFAITKVLFFFVLISLVNYFLCEVREISKNNS
jgi:hypothetical protein